MATNKRSRDRDGKLVAGGQKARGPLHTNRNRDQIEHRKPISNHGLRTADGRQQRHTTRIYQVNLRSKPSHLACPKSEGPGSSGPSGFQSAQHTLKRSDLYCLRLGT
jgi:hypothetical protein